MTVKELTQAAKDHKIFIVDLYGASTELNPESPLQLAAYGDYVIESISATERERIEITIKLQPVKAQ